MEGSSSFAELAKVQIIEKSSSNVEDERDFNGLDVLFKNNPPSQNFYSLLDELEFQSCEASKSESTSTIPAEKQLQLSDDEEEDDEIIVEDVEIKYPYERKDIHQGLLERINEKLESGKPESIVKADETLEEIEEELKRAKLVEKMQKFDRFKELKLANDSFLVCLFCSKSFDTPEILQNHVQEMHDVSKKMFKCTICGVVYKRKKNLVLHKKRHEVSTEYECKECCFVFKNELSLRAHVVRAHQSETKEAESFDKEKLCEVCQKMVPESTFKRHEYYCKNKEKISKQRAEKKSISVPPSPAFSITSVASFSSLGSIGSTNVSPNVSYVDKKCKVCGERFASRQSMLRHIGRKHPEFKDDSNVTAKRYVSIESPAHQYACQECGKRFTTRAALSLHKDRIHEKNSRHECDICHKAYPIASELRKHTIRVHRGKPIKNETLIEMEF